MSGKFVIFITSAILVLSGCAPQIQEPLRIQEPLGVCPGAESVNDLLSLLMSRSQNTVPLKANGQCHLQYFVEGKRRKENFPVKLWVNPPVEIYLQGDVAFNPKGLVLGSNEREFWLSMKPKKISTYWWGRWSEAGGLEKLIISPRQILEAVGIIEIVGEENWSLSHEDGFDVLTKREGGTESRKIYVDSCDYLVRRMEYFGANGETAVAVELDKYKRVFKDLFVPSVIKIVRRGAEDGRDSISVGLRLGSIRPVTFTEEAQRRLFSRPRPRGFEHIYEIIDSDVIEQRQ